MIRIREIDHLVLRVVDLERMLRFYCDALGCSVERRQEALGLVQLRAGRSLLDLVPVAGKLGQAGGAKSCSFIRRRGVEDLGRFQIAPLIQPPGDALFPAAMLECPGGQHSLMSSIWI